MIRIISTLFILVFVAVSIGCSSNDSLPELIAPEDGRYSVIITSHDSGEEWQEIIKHYIDAEIIQIITYGGIDTPAVEQVFNDYEIKIEEEITALVFDHEQFVFKTTNPQELEEFFEGLDH